MFKRSGTTQSRPSARASRLVSLQPISGMTSGPTFWATGPMVEALLSRLRHYCHTVRIDGPSLCELQG
jgi:hypothetical protein